MDDGGLMDRFGKMETALLGTVNGSLGLVPRFNLHCEQHERELAARKAEWRRLIAVLTAAAAGMGSLVSWAINYFFHR
jgi:hypothetical protein